jgi:hypothetical protein
MAVKITASSVPRDVIDAAELTTKERGQFGYPGWEAIGSGEPGVRSQPVRPGRANGR